MSRSPRRPSLARLRARDRLSRLAGRAAGLADRGSAWTRRLAARRTDDDAASRFMDYGPDWPPAPATGRVRPRRHPLLRRCVAAVVLYAVIWALGSVLLQLRLFQLHDAGGVPVTTYTTVTTGPRSH